MSLSYEGLDIPGHSMLITFILAPTQIMLTGFLNYKLHRNEVKKSEMMTFEGCLSAHCELRSLVKDSREGLCKSWVTTVICGLEAAFPVKKTYSRLHFSWSYRYKTEHTEMIYTVLLYLYSNLMISSRMIP